LNSLLILGAGGHGKVVAETAIATGDYSQIAFLDDNCNCKETTEKILGWPVLNYFSYALSDDCRAKFSLAVVALGHAPTRLKWLKILTAASYDCPVLIHPKAWVSPSASISMGSVVFAQAAVQSEADIGIGAILNTGCGIDHDVRLGAGVHICPGAYLAAEVQVGDCSWIGIGASVIQQIRIGADVTIGAGAAVVTDLPDEVTAVGIPARIRSKQ